MRGARVPSRPLRLSPIPTGDCCHGFWCYAFASAARRARPILEAPARTRRSNHRSWLCSGPSLALRVNIRPLRRSYSGAPKVATDIRTTPTIRQAGGIRKQSLHLLVQTPIRPQNVAYVSLNRAGRYSVCRLPLPSRKKAMLKMPRRTTDF
jgi:hypothetical protein